MTLSVEAGIALGAAVLQAAVVWGAVKASLNGARIDIIEIKGDVKAIIATQTQQGERIAHLEAKVEP